MHTGCIQRWRYGIYIDGGASVHVELILHAEVDGFREKRAAALGFTSPADEVLEHVVEAIGGDDARTLAVSYDSQGSRWKVFRECVLEMTEDRYPDWPVDDPRTVLWLMKHVLRGGQSPIQWVENYLSRRPYPATDRSQYELRSIAEVLEYAACYDHMNLSNLSCFELLARRWRFIISAHEKDVTRPDYHGAGLFNGLGSEMIGVAPGLTKVVASGLKEKAEIERSRAAARGVNEKVPPVDPKAKAKGDPKGGGSA